jgi:hypothetical protein
MGHACSDVGILTRYEVSAANYGAVGLTGTKGSATQQIGLVGLTCVDPHSKTVRKEKGSEFHYIGHKFLSTAARRYTCIKYNPQES